MVEALLWDMCQKMYLFHMSYCTCAYLGMAGWSSRRSRGGGEHQSAPCRSQTHRRSMRRPQREGWHPAFHKWDRRTHCQAYGATQTVRFHLTFLMLDDTCIVKTIRNTLSIGSNCNPMPPIGGIFYPPGKYVVACQPWAWVLQKGFKLFEYGVTVFLWRGI